MKMQVNSKGEPKLRIPVKESPREVLSPVQPPRHEEALYM